MTYSMASLLKKTIRGKTYYYARECRRGDGKPKIVRQKYLGRADDIIAALTPLTPPWTTAPEKAVITEFGAVVALYDVARRLRLVEHIDRHVPAPRGPRGPSVGQYLLTAALNRCLDPRSKVQIAAWYQRTALRRLLDFRPEQLTSQRFWDQMDRVSPEAIVLIERDLLAHLLVEFGVDVRQVLFDATNFFTFIDTFNERCTLAQRGHSKEGRAALRIVGLALLVFGSGAVRGFAVVHCLGILTSMFSAVFVSRGVVNLWYGRKKKLAGVSIGTVWTPGLSVAKK